jgi:hypothetical protein
MMGRSMVDMQNSLRSDTAAKSTIEKNDHSENRTGAVVSRLQSMATSYEERAFLVR